MKITKQDRYEIIRSEAMAQEGADPIVGREFFLGGHLHFVTQTDSGPPDLISFVKADEYRVQTWHRYLFNSCALRMLSSRPATWRKNADGMMVRTKS